MSAIGATTSTSALTTPTTSTSTTSSGNIALSFSGLASGIDTSSIITALTKFGQQQITQLNTQASSIATKQSAFATLQSDLTTLQSSANALSSGGFGAFNAYTATPSDTSVVSAVAGTAAVPGNYTLTVKALAQSEQVASGGFSDRNATIQQGTFSVKVGSGTATTVTINGNNNTLQGLSTAINAAGGDVSASIINDGSGTPYRLVLTSDQTGAANSIAVTNNLTTGTGASIDATNTVLQAATDAQVTIGTNTTDSNGATTSSALTVTSPTNQLNAVIPGVSLNLLSAKPSEAVTLTVANDTAAAVTAVQSFVTAYNAVNDYITQQTAYTAGGANTGVLIGNSTVLALKNALSGALSTTVGGVNANANQLSAAGLQFNSSGDLTLNSATLTSALNGQTPGVSAADIKSLFALSGTSDNTGVQFITGGSTTQPTAGTPYKVQITTPATQATAVATTVPAYTAEQVSVSGSTITITPPNNTLSIELNGLIAAGITLPTNVTYTPTSILAAIQSAINSAPALQGNSVAVGLNSSGNVQITSELYGSSSQISVAGGAAGTLAAQLGFTNTVSNTGTDVAGSFVVNGKTEAATGSGQYLVGNTGNANTAGLDVQSTLSSPGTANLTVSQGLASQLNTVLNTYLDPINGTLATINTAYDRQTTNINTEITQANTALSTQTTQLQTQFANMETAINSLKTVQAQLSSFGTASYLPATSTSGL